MRRKTKNLLKYAGIGFGALALSYTLNKFVPSNLTPEDFENADWYSSYNESGRIWTPYMNEDIPHNQDNWETYQEEVKKRNRGKLEGDIILPDLDEDKSVGKDK